MTEAEWLACADPDRILEFLREKACERKLRYFLVACARNRLPPSPDDDMVEALAVAERYADGRGSKHDLARARKSLKKHHQARVTKWWPLYTAHIRSVPAWHAARERIVRAAGEGARCCAWSSTRHEFSGGTIAMTFPSDELTTQACFLRDIFGNPFRPVTLAPAWLAWNDSTIVRLARAIYDDRRFNELPVLADALEEAGCTDAAILSHLRGPEPHVRGCWVLDLLLGNE
jgi:hypothetical protein